MIVVVLAGEREGEAPAKGRLLVHEAGERTEDCEFDFGAPKTRFGEDATHDGIVEDGQDQVLQVHLNGTRLLEVEVLRFAALRGLRPLDGSHERVRHRRIVAAARV